MAEAEDINEFGKDSQFEDRDSTETESLRELEARVDALARGNFSLRDEVEGLQDELEALQDELESEREERRRVEKELDGLRDRVQDVDARTDLLALVDSENHLSKKQRCAILVQHLKKKAEDRRERGEPAKSQLDKDGWEDVLHNPDLERTSAFKDMQRAAELVGNEDVLFYQDGQLRLNLEGDGAEDVAAFTRSARGEHL